MRPALAFSLMLLMGTATVRANDDSVTNAELFARAEAAFQKGIDAGPRFRLAQKHFGASANAYVALHDRGVRSALLYRNLGNAAGLADRWPEAIWAYHMGLKLDPNDADLRANLAFVRGKVMLPPAGQGRPDPDAWPVWLHRPTLSEWFAVSATAYVLAWIAGALAFATGRMSYHVLALGMIGVTLASGAGLWWSLREAETDRATPLLIVKTNTQLSLGNAASYDPNPRLAILPRGMEARLVHQRGGWMQVRLTTGEIGWLPRRQVLIVEP